MCKLFPAIFCAVKRYATVLFSRVDESLFVNMCLQIRDNGLMMDASYKVWSDLV